MTLVTAFGFERSPWLWVALVVGGIVGAILVAVIFDWALILLSSLLGASLIMEGLRLPSPYPWLGVLILVVIGVMIQAGIRRNEQQSPNQKRA